jgi:peptide-methionine (S)-S-oxide reductase
MESTLNNSSPQATATLAGGCFWCLEAVFDELKGVNTVVSGYAGGTVPDPSYRDVCSGRTGHAEVVQIIYDPQVVSYRELLEIFFTIHDPTTPNRQGNDVGSQYRSAIFYHDQDQKVAAEKIIAELNAEGIWRNPIVTQLEPYTTFYPAEDYHQDYYNRNRNQPYCRVVIDPKVSKLRAHFQDKLSPEKLR